MKYNFLEIFRFFVNVNIDCMENYKNTYEEKLNIERILSFTEEDINKLNYKEVEEAQSTMLHSVDMHIQDKAYLNKHNPNGNRFHPIYELLIKRRAEIEYTKDK